jgi:pyruvate kinase
VSTSGAEERLGTLVGGAHSEGGERVRLVRKVAAEAPGDINSTPGFHGVKMRHTLLIDDGKGFVCPLSVGENSAEAMVSSAARSGSKGVNLPDTFANSAMTPQRTAARRGADLGVDWIARCPLCSVQKMWRS